MDPNQSQVGSIVPEPAVQSVTSPVAAGPAPVPNGVSSPSNDGKCKKCGQPLVPGNHFCSFCNYFAYDPNVGKKAGLFKRWLANIIDPIVIVFTLGIAEVILWTKGNTPGHALLGMKIVKSDGSKPSFGTMFLREFVGKLISTLFFGLGYFWAIWDKDRQAWHDKIAGTFVVEE